MWGDNTLKLVPEHYHPVTIISGLFLLQRVMLYMQAYFCRPIVSLTLICKLMARKRERDLHKSSLIQDS